MIYGKKMNFLLCGVNALALTPAVASAKPAENKNADNRPNVLLIAIDDMKPWIGPMAINLQKHPRWIVLPPEALLSATLIVRWR